MIRTLTTVVSFGERYSTTVDVTQTTLSDEQVQVLSGLVHVLYHDDHYSTDNSIKCTLEGAIMVEDQEKFVWEGDTITNTRSDGSTYEFKVQHVDGYLVLHCPIDFEGYATTITFKDGMLESIGDQPAVKRTDAVETYNISTWFHRNTCYRAANPDQPANISYGWHIYYNPDDMRHRDITKGPAMYQPKGDTSFTQYYVDGVKCDKYGEPIVALDHIWYSTEE